TQQRKTHNHRQSKPNRHIHKELSLSLCVSCHFVQWFRGSVVAWRTGLKQGLSVSEFSAFS
ncbi:unnamed protein product, partial [Prunus brigantina]